MSLTDTSDPSNMSSTASVTSPSAASMSTPSPSISNAPAAMSTMTAAAPRRPSRKSTLTQQQKNNKRQRATQDQLVTLEHEFHKNPTPTAATRERIAQEINMTERSVQIWFQNKRAKIKMLAKKSIETGEGCDSIPESMRQYLAMQFDPTKPGTRDLFGRTAGFGATGVYPGESGSGKVGGYSLFSFFYALSHWLILLSLSLVIHHFTCRSLSIGNWRRIGQNAMDLVVFYSPEKASMTYYINNDSAGYKIEYPFSYIKNITLESGDHQSSSPVGAAPRPAGLIVELNRPPLFYMDSSNSGGFYQCGDFTEDQQASQIMVHHLGGHPKVLSVQLAKLVSLESFQNRMAYSNNSNNNNNNNNNNGGFAVPAPAVSPLVIPRPASQPNHFAPAFLGMYQDPNSLGFNPVAVSTASASAAAAAAAVSRGHRRQRSRSVPVAVDFASMQHHQPFLSLNQPPDHGLFAPIPQSTHPLAMNLRIDTSTAYGIDPLRTSTHPMSATTTASPSDFASPSLFVPGDTTPVANLSHQFSMPFLSSTTMEAGSTPTAPTATISSPFSVMSPADPMIADQSPPLANMPHASPDLFRFSADQSQPFPEDNTLLNDMFSKHNITFVVPPSMTLEGTSPFDLSMHTAGLTSQSSASSPGLQGDFQGLGALSNVDPHLAPGS
ncbi:hypothetical protein ASPZODRAFT_154053 [Penicilliopsis zonata CBS 506.65]|uniref:Homeobox domain-containing protein n=1 Tax=Penicilliopsis zonata CBS 506.65 TaxID=1073090 RepID=A0A1L9SA76_9EURO|nr:hypothetical protein ASPZODRAFT_154053 [Penicilliopsis zonata CBS 506.65]OJJ44085.1 hypothetical protein ASPZODRAFT_154053 [Penicilliopsis zonata CBS 506.65]